MADGSLFSIPDFGPWRLEQSDAVAFLQALPDESVDVVVVDPAYESLEKHRAKGTTTRLKKSKASSNEWFPIFPNARFEELFKQFFRVLAPDRHLYMYCDSETMFVAKPLAEAAGFKFWKPLVWDKGTVGMGYHWRCTYEFVLFFEKGKRALSSFSESDVQRFPRVRGAYPTEKPQALSEVLIAQSTVPGEIVCDVFSGSGSAAAAAVKLGRRFLGCDIQEHAVTLGRERLANAFAERMAFEKEHAF